VRSVLPTTPTEQKPVKKTVHTARYVPQPLVGIVTMGAAGAVVVGVWFLVPRSTVFGPDALSTAILAVFLVSAYILANHFPIQVRTDMLVCVGSVPALLMAALLPVPVAAIGFVIGKTVGELSVRKSRGGFYSDVASQVGRWVIVGTAASIVAHLPDSAGTHYNVPLIGAVATMWLGDILTSPLVLCPITGDGPWRIMRSVARDAGATEGAQYLIGILGVLAAQEARWSILLLAFPTALVYLAFKSARDVRETSRHLLASIVDTSPDAILVLDINCRIIAANQRATAIFKYTDSNDLIGLDVIELVSIDGASRTRADIDSVLRTATTPISEFVARRADGSTFQAEMLLAPVRNRQGSARAITCVMRDISRQKQAALELEQRALHDALTGIPNRTLFNDRLRQTIARVERENTEFAILVLDLNTFKEANDTYGHLCGDFILQEMSRRFVRILRDSDTVARLGGDEFAILLARADAAGARIVASRIQESVRVSFDFEGQSIKVGTSIGIALYGPDGDDPDLLVRQADSAMYVSKRTGAPWVFAGAHRGIYREPTALIAS
jgi:diguanylate cyclase (GGDEF)-like protein/PAS domain S-box-containing protein